MIILLIDIYFFRGSPTSPAGPGPDKPSYVCGARSGKVHYNMLAKICQSMKLELRSMKNEDENDEDDDDENDECQSLLNKLSNSKSEFYQINLILSAISANTPTITGTRESPNLQSSSDPCPSLLAVVGGRLLQLGRTLPSSGSLSVRGRNHHHALHALHALQVDDVAVVDDVLTDINPLHVNNIVIHALRGLAVRLNAAGEIINCIITMFNDRFTTTSYCWSGTILALSWRLLCTGCSRRGGNTNPASSWITKLNLKNHVEQDIFTSRVTDRVKLHSMTPVYLFTKIPNLCKFTNFQVYLVTNAL